MTDEKDPMKELMALESSQMILKSKLTDIQLGINKILIKFPIIYIDSWDGAGEYEDGRHVINADIEKVRPVEKIESGYRGNFVIFKTKEPVKLKDYFTQEEIISIRKY